MYGHQTFFGVNFVLFQIVYRSQNKAFLWPFDDSGSLASILWDWSEWLFCEFRNHRQQLMLCFDWVIQGICWFPDSGRSILSSESRIRFVELIALSLLINENWTTCLSSFFSRNWEINVVLLLQAMLKILTKAVKTQGETNNFKTKCMIKIILATVWRRLHYLKWCDWCGKGNHIVC